MSKNLKESPIRQYMPSPMPAHLVESPGLNFGIDLDKCEPSSISAVSYLKFYFIFYLQGLKRFHHKHVPAVVEICTRLIECQINDEGTLVYNI